MGWEYKTVNVAFNKAEALFNELAAQGWELSSATTQLLTIESEPDQYGRVIEMQRVETWAIFEREKEEQPNIIDQG